MRSMFAELNPGYLKFELHAIEWLDSYSRVD